MAEHAHLKPSPDWRDLATREALFWCALCLAMIKVPVLAAILPHQRIEPLSTDEFEDLMTRGGLWLIRAYCLAVAGTFAVLLVISVWKWGF